MWINTNNTFNDRLVYDLQCPNFPVTKDPIDDRIKKNTIINDWTRTLGTAPITKFSTQVITENDKLEYYNYLSSLVYGREAINFLSVYTYNKKTIYTEYYNAIRDINTFARDAGADTIPIRIQIAAILLTLRSNKLYI